MTLWRRGGGVVIGLVTVASTGCFAWRGPPILDLIATREISCPLGPRDATPLAIGAFLGDAETRPGHIGSAIARYTSRVGAPPAIVKSYHSFSSDFSLTGTDGQVIRAVLAVGTVTPMMSIEPTGPGVPARGSLAFIADGGADSVIRVRAREISRLIDATTTSPALLIELAAEMNARFGAPWQAGANGDSVASADFVRMWRHVVAIFRAEDVINVAWVWSASAGNPYTNRPTGAQHWNWQDRYYPGDDVVDMVGIHAFNDPRSQGAWVPFEELVDGDAADHMFTDLLERHPTKGLIFGELATDEHPRSRNAKARWITNAFARVRACPAIRAVVWFDMRKERDWRIASSSRSWRAFRNAAYSSTASRASPDSWYEATAWPPR
jgi:hypothetical protein